MAIDPTKFVAPAAGSRQARRNAAIVRRSADLLRNSASILNAPTTIKNQVNATVNRTIKRIPGRIKNAANNIAINAVTDIATGAWKGFSSGGGIQGVVEGGFSQGFNGLSGNVLGAADQILGQVGSDIGLGVGGVINNIGGGILTGIGNPIISKLSNISIESVIDGIGDAGTAISGLFTGDGFGSAEGGDNPLGAAIEAVDGDTRESLQQVAGLSSNDISHCSEGSKQKVQETADLLKTEGRTLIGDVDSHIAVNTSGFSEAQNKTHNQKTQALTAQVRSWREATAEVKAIHADVLANCPPEDPATFEHEPKHFASKLWPKHHPKSKFMFMVEFVFHPEYENLMTQNKDAETQSHIKAAIENKLGFEFVVKNSTRPNITFEHEEVNMYNYWTKVPKRTIYEPMTMRFYDDEANSTNTFYTNYMRAMSPIANMGGSDSMILPNQYQENSTDLGVAVYASDRTEVLQGGASLGPLNNDAINILLEIKVYHLYDWGRSLNVYHMYNPKITNLNLDDVDMAESGAGSELEIQFSYDGLFVEPRRVNSIELMEKISGGRTGVNSEIVPVFDNAEDTSGTVIDDAVFTHKLKDKSSAQITPDFASSNVEPSSSHITPDYDNAFKSADTDIWKIGQKPGVF